MKIQTINNLCCPFCSGPLRVKEVTQENEHGVHFGLVKCRSCQLNYPVVAGILILGSPSEQINVWDEVSDNPILNGVELRKLCDLLSEKRNVEAFSLLLTPAGRGNLLFRPIHQTSTAMAQDVEILRPCREKKSRVPLRIQWILNRLSCGRLQQSCQYQLADFILRHAKDLAATDVIRLFYGDFSCSEMANYFTFRFGQPRHLAALAIASIIKERSGPVLDLACGMGHLTHYFAWGEEYQRQVVGVDRDYFRLYVAKNFMVPEADFICQWVDRPLPFPSLSFDSIFCSDAFHYFLNKAGSLREMKRVLASNGLIAITRFGNLEQTPNEGYELTAEDYDRLFGDMKHILLGEDELIEGYLKKRKANLELREISKELREQKWLSVVMSNEDNLFCNQGCFSEYPHGMGHLIKNPIYSSKQKASSNRLNLKFEFPSEHYAFEDQKYQSYTLNKLDISPEVLSSLNSGMRINDLQDLVEKFVLIGVPKKFIPT
ncbi:MAG: methyltransferase domain-containing protein [Elainella sp. C42_A2020_010]|nr:methyltransferase domain-containing protein [Elainella sp. C42_A2020_010]